MVMAYSPLGQGLLSGRYNATNRPTSGIRATSAMFLPENLDAAAPLLNLLRDLGSTHDASPAQIALAWLLARSPVILPIPGTSSVEHLEQNWDARRIALSADEVVAIAREG
jgi:aryl-alcohol dehydrogenase-like predicted oxidoreductase